MDSIVHGKESDPTEQLSLSQVPWKAEAGKRFPGRGCMQRQRAEEALGVFQKQLARWQTLRNEAGQVMQWAI